MSKATNLGDKMRELAARRPEPVASELRELGEAFDRASIKAYGIDGTSDDTKTMMGAWARARRAYCRETGESLV